METFSVRDISEMLNVNQETVRRWIRQGKLRAEKTSNKKGNVISRDDLIEFGRSSPVYAKAIAATVGAMAVGMPALLPAVIAGGIALNRQKQGAFEEPEITEKAIIKLIEEEISDLKRGIGRKALEAQKLLAEAEMLDEEINADKRKIAQYEKLLASGGPSFIQRQNGEIDKRTGEVALML